MVIKTGDFDMFKKLSIENIEKSENMSELVYSLQGITFQINMSVMKAQWGSDDNS